MTKYLQIGSRISPKAMGFWLKEPSAKIHSENDLQQNGFWKMKNHQASSCFVKMATFVFAFLWFFSSGFVFGSLRRSLVLWAVLAPQNIRL